MTSVIVGNTKQMEQEKAKDILVGAHGTGSTSSDYKVEKLVAKRMLLNSDDYSVVYDTGYVPTHPMDDLIVPARPGNSCLKLHKIYLEPTVSLKYIFDESKAEGEMFQIGDEIGEVVTRA